MLDRYQYSARAKPELELSMRGLGGAMPMMVGPLVTRSGGKLSLEFVQFERVMWRDGRER